MRRKNLEHGDLEAEELAEAVRNLEGVGEDLEPVGDDLANGLERGALGDGLGRVEPLDAGQDHVRRLHLHAVGEALGRSSNNLEETEKEGGEERDESDDLKEGGEGDADKARQVLVGEVATRGEHLQAGDRALDLGRGRKRRRERE